jgi:hypothetical protein
MRGASLFQIALAPRARALENEKAARNAKTPRCQRRDSVRKMASTRLRLLSLIAVGGVAACGAESFSGARRDAGAIDDTIGDGPAGGADEGGDAGADSGGDVGQDGPGTDGAGMDGPGGDALPQFLRVWTFDQASAGVDGWGTSFGLAGSTVAYDGAAGSPNPGSLVVNVPFASANGGEQYAIQASTGIADLTHRHVSAVFRLESGGPAQGRVAFSTTANYVLVISPPVTLAPGVWTTVTLDVDNPPPGSFIDPSHLDADGGVIPPMPADTRLLAVLVNSPYLSGVYTPAVVHIDMIGYY